jgi:hypothetical protein
VDAPSYTAGSVCPIVGLDVTEIDGTGKVGEVAHALVGTLSLAALGSTYSARSSMSEG